MRVGLSAMCLLLVSHAAIAADRFARLADPATAPYEISGTGFLTDAGHPMHPGDFRRYDVAIRLRFDPELGEAVTEVESGDGDKKDVDRYFFRRGRIFQVDDKGNEVPAEPLGDLSPATLAALHPALVANAIRERRENLRPNSGGKGFLFAWNDELWTVQDDPRSGRIAKLERRTFHDVLGDGTEEVRFEAWPPGGGALAPGRVVVVARGREVARFDYGAATPSAAPELPAGTHERDRARLAAEREIEFREIAPHLFASDITGMNTRVFVAEFGDHVAVLEGAYNSRTCDRIAHKVHERFGKPVRYFAFSHLHGQYVGGTRSWVHEGATVLVPPSTAPLIEQIVKAPVTLRPDVLSADRQPLRLETVTEKRVLQDATNTLEIYNVASGHTDEYFIFYFPRQKVLMTGDLLFYRPGKPLTGRSKQLCETIQKLGLDVETYYPTWPLDGYGTKNIVTAEEMRAGCAESKAP